MIFDRLFNFFRKRENNKIECRISFPPMPPRGHLSWENVPREEQRPLLEWQRQEIIRTKSLLELYCEREQNT